MAIEDPTLDLDARIVDVIKEICNKHENISVAEIIVTLVCRAAIVGVLCGKDSVQAKRDAFMAIAGNAFDGAIFMQNLPEDELQKMSAGLDELMAKADKLLN